MGRSALLSYRLGLDLGRLTGIEPVFSRATTARLNHSTIAAMRSSYDGVIDGIRTRSKRSTNSCARPLHYDHHAPRPRLTGAEAKDPGLSTRTEPLVAGRGLSHLLRDELLLLITACGVR